MTFSKKKKSCTLKENRKGYMGGLEGGKGRKKFCNYNLKKRKWVLW